MIISPPFLPASGLASSDASKPDPMMDTVDQFEIGHHGVYPVTFDRRFHGGIHLNPGEQHEPVRAIADGDVVAYRVCKNAISDGTTDSTTGQPALNSNAGFVLLRHKTDTGDGRTITYHSLYMHLLDMTGQENIAPQPHNPPETGSADALPKWLLDTAGGKDGVVQLGGTKKVYRKDMLGYVGRHQDVSHLHFEIFMADADFTAWFDQDGHKVQLGEKNLAQPRSGDYWGHSYFVIHGPQEFVVQPAGMTDTRFPRLPGGSIGSDDTLYVEAWFNKGRRYTQAWIDRGNSGNVTLLTPDPVADPYDNGTDSHHNPKRYEYDMHDRAMALYPACPSDGYEMLRFGRILSEHPTLTAAACATWIAVPFDENGTLGYLNIAPDAIKKLSDADFPFFTGWQKVDSDNTPFNDAGRCNYASLCGLTGIQDSLPSAQPLEADPNNNNEFNLQLASYVQNTDGVDKKLRGMVFKAHSEWDPSSNDDRYKDLNDADGFFGKQKDVNPDGYTNFIVFLSKFQFLDATPLAGQKLWFFHPLAFIRHFRKCGWLSQNEFKQIYSDKRYSRNQIPPPSQLRDTYLGPLNLATRKFGLTSPARLAHFLGQGAVESAWLASMQETSMLSHLQSDGFHGTVTNPASEVAESMLGHWYGQIPTEDDAWFRSTKFNRHGTRITGSYDWRNGNCDREDAQKFRGRGFKQLTGRSNYADYWTFKAWISSTSFTASWWTDSAYLAHNRSGMTKIPAMIDAPQRVALPENSLDSGGFYLRFERPNVARHIDQDSSQMAISDADKQKERQISRDVTYAINGGYIDWERRLDFARSAKDIIS